MPRRRAASEHIHTGRNPEWHSHDHAVFHHPGRLLLTGQIGDLGVFDITQLRGISRTAPYFHNNSAATLEEVLDHYQAFFRRVARVARLNPPPNLPPIISSNGLVIDRGFIAADERAALLAYLRKL